jgi:hypothetical protein
MFPSFRPRQNVDRLKITASIWTGVEIKVDLSPQSTRWQRFSLGGKLA